MHRSILFRGKEGSLTEAKVVLERKSSVHYANSSIEMLAADE